MNEHGGPTPGDEQPEQPDWPDMLVVPDDPSALEADVLALRRERLAADRRARWQRWTGGTRFRAYGVSIPVVVVAVLVVAGFGALLVLLGPRAGPTSDPIPKAGQPTAQPGRAGGRLPSASLREPDGATIDASTLTSTAAVVLVPADCACQDTVEVLTSLSVRAGLRAVVVEPTTGAAGAVNALGDERVVGYSDSAGRLLSVYGATGSAPTLLLLDHTGAVRTITTGVTAGSAHTALADAIP